MSHRPLLSALILLAATTALADQVRIYTTTADGKKQLEYSALPSSRGTTKHLTLKPSTTYQDIDGFGYAITYSASYNLLQMAAADRREFLTRTFSRESGCGVSYVRISIGCSDFSSTEYTLCDSQGLQNFRLYKDETDYVIPILKEILAINPNLKIIASPWTCPKWMKVKSITNTVGYDSWTSGSLNPAYRQAYADYFVKFVQAFAAEGIDIYAVTPQNEPLNKGNCASLYMPWDEEAAFVNKLAPAFAHAGIKTKIYCFDHNYNYDNKSDQTDYPIQFYNALDPNMDGRELVVGSAWHNYGGSPSELDDISQKAPDREMIFSEASIGTWNDGRNLSARLIYDTKDLIYNTVSRGCKASIVWNFMLDENRGPNLSGGCTTCYGAVDIMSDWHTLQYNSHYYLMAHASLAAQPGAKRIGSSLSTSISSFYSLSFLNPDGSYGTVFINEGSSSQMMSMGVDKITTARFTVPAKSVVTVVLGGEEEKKPQLGANAIGTTKQHGRYSATLDMKQLETLTQDFIDEPSAWHIDPDFFWYDEESGTLTFLPIDGTYTVEVDKNARTLLAAPLAADLTAEGQGNIYICGPAKSVGRVFFYPGTETLPENAIAMAEVEDGLYEYTFAVNEQLNNAVVDYAFYTKADLSELFSGKTGAARFLTYDMTKGTTYFALGKGSSGHADGHIYKRASSIKLLDSWTTVVDIRAGLDKGVVYVKKHEEGLPTAISQPAPAINPTAIYDLTGRRLQTPPTRGIFIQNGRKVVVQ